MYNDQLAILYKQVFLSCIYNKLIHGTSEPEPNSLSRFIKLVKILLQTYLKANGFENINIATFSVMFKNNMPGKVFFKRVVINDGEGASFSITFSRRYYNINGYTYDEGELIYDCITVIEKVICEEIYEELYDKFINSGCIFVKQEWVSAVKNFIYLYKYYTDELTKTNTIAEAESVLQSGKNSYWQIIYNLETLLILGVADILDEANYRDVTISVRIRLPINFWTDYEKDLIPQMEIDALELLHRNKVYKYFFSSANNEVFLADKANNQFLDDEALRKIAEFFTFSATILHKIIDGEQL